MAAAAFATASMSAEEILDRVDDLYRGDSSHGTMTMKVKTSHWTDGCATSLSCNNTAAHLARGKSPDEIIKIDSETIQKSVGGLSRDHTHCADLAFETLQAALDNRMRRQRR